MTFKSNAVPGRRPSRGIDALQALEHQQAGRGDDQRHQYQKQDLVLQIECQQPPEAGKPFPVGCVRFHDKAVLAVEWAGIVVQAFHAANEASPRPTAPDPFIPRNAATSLSVDLHQLFPPVFL